MRWWERYWVEVLLAAHSVLILYLLIRGYA